MRRGPALAGRGRGAIRTTGRGAGAGVFDFAAGLLCGRFAGRLGPPIDAPEACVAPFGGSGAPAFTCGRFAGRLGAIFGAPRLTPGFPAAGRGAAAAGFSATFTGAFGAAFAATFTTAFAFGFTSAAFGAGLAAAFGAGLAVAFGATFGATFGAGFFAAGFGAGGALKMRERMPFFSATGGHEFHKVGDAAAVAPLVVIPGDDFGEVVAKQHRARRIDNRRTRIPTEV